jgi:hypothetical protein
LQGGILRSPSTSLRINSAAKNLTISLSFHEILRLRGAPAQNDNTPQIHFGGVLETLQVGTLLFQQAWRRAVRKGVGVQEFPLG